jgi:triphosphatase
VATEPREIELKLGFPRDAAAALQRHPALQPPGAAEWELRQEHTVYFDTPTLELAGQGLSLRIRRRGDRRIQTLKSAGDRDGAAASRGEWEWPVDQDHPDLALLADTPFGNVIPALVERRLRPLCETRIDRLARDVRLGGDTVVEVVLDQGQVSAGDRVEEICELELELKQGNPGPVYRLALALLADIPLTIGVESKAARGQRLLTGKVPEAVESVRTTLDRNIRMDAAFRRLMGAEIGHVLANQPAACRLDTEGIHEMRIGIRRLRSLLALFGTCLEPGGVQQFAAALKQFGQVLGAARDWDVFCTQLLPEAASHKRLARSVLQLTPAAEAARHATHLALQHALLQPSFTALCVGLAAWIEPGSAPIIGAEALRPLRKLAPEMMDRLARKVAKRGGHRRKRSLEQLHDLRKALKKLHYSAQDVAPLYPEKPAKRFLRACKRLQKTLGDGNDCTMAVRLAEQLRTTSIDLEPSIHALVRWNGKRRDKVLGRLPETWAYFDDTPGFWR